MHPLDQRAPTTAIRPTNEPPSTSYDNQGPGRRMNAITRLGSTVGLAPLPVISQIVIRDESVFLLGVTGDPPADVATQTRQVLQRIDQLLASAGTDKSNLLTAQVWLADMDDFDAHNAVWNEWVDPANPPVRACVEARLWQPGLRVEIMVTAATGASPSAARSG